MSKDGMGNWVAPADRYSRWFGVQGNALEETGIVSPGNALSALFKQETAEAVAELTSLCLMGATGEGHFKLWDPELEFHYHFLFPRYDGVTYKDMVTWLQYHPNIRQLPFSSPKWLNIYRHIDRLGSPGYHKHPTVFLDLTKEVQGEGEPCYRRRWRNYDELAPVTHEFGFREAVACLIFPGDFDPENLIVKPEDIAGETGLTPFRVDRWALPEEIRMALLLQGLRLAKEEDLGTELLDHPFWIDDGVRGLKPLNLLHRAFSSHEPATCIDVLGKPLGELVDCGPDCGSEIAKRNREAGIRQDGTCTKCDGLHRRVVMPYQGTSIERT